MELCGLCTYTKSPDMPLADYFKKYFSYFVMDNPDAECAMGGHAAYAGVSSKLFYLLYLTKCLLGNELCFG